jgi:hypothetical protein
MSNGGTSSAKDVAVPNPLTAEANCTYLYTPTSGSIGTDIHNTNTDLSKIPSADMYGNAMNTAGYTHSRIVDQHGNVSSIYNGTALNQTIKNRDYHWGLAIWNSVDNAANRVRNDSNFVNRTGDTQSMPVTIHVIAYTANNGVDEGLLKRVANTTDSSSFDTAQPRGMYVPAGDSTALAAAFNDVASAILHLSR